MADRQYVNGRIVGGYSTHAEHKPELCEGREHAWRCVDCCGVEDDRDILECQVCGKQKSVACSFDEDFS